MKYKKMISIALCIGLVTSGLSGIRIISAKNSPDTEEAAINEEAYAYSKAEEPDIIGLEPDTAAQAVDSNIYSTQLEDSDSVIHEEAENIEDSGDLFDLGREDIQELLESGFSMKDIIEADELGNDIAEDPKELLEHKKNSDQSFEQIKEDILKERKEDNRKYLKNKYEKEYKEIKGKSFNDEDTYTLLSYMDVYGEKLTKDLMKDYKEKGTKSFKNSNKEELSKATKNKYNISDKDATGLTEEIIKMIEKVSEDTGEPVKKLIKSYIRDINH
jgi:hypothetical protein